MGKSLGGKESQIGHRMDESERGDSAIHAGTTNARQETKPHKYLAEQEAHSRRHD